MSKKKKPIRTHHKVPENEETGEWYEICNKRANKCDGNHKNQTNEQTNSSNNPFINYWNSMGNI